MGARSVVIPTASTELLLADDFLRGSPGEAHGSSPTFIKNTATWQVQDFAGDETAIWDTQADGTGLHCPDNGTPGSNDFIHIDIGEPYTKVLIKFQVATTEILSIGFHSTADAQRNAAGHTSAELRVQSSTNYNSRLRSNIAGTTANVVDDGLLNGDGTSDFLASAILENAVSYVMCTYNPVTDKYAMNINGVHARSWARPAGVTLSNILHVTFTSQFNNCFITDLKVWK